MTDRRMSFGVALLFLALTLTGCTAPSITNPVGESWDKEVVKSLEGLWNGGEDNDEYMLANMGEDGKMYMGLIDFDPKKREYEVGTLEVTFARLGEHDFAFVKMGDLRGYFFLQIVKFDSNSVHVRAPDDELFVKAIQQDSSLGEILRPSKERKESSERALVNGDGDAFSKILTQYGVDRCFPKEHEGVYRRIAEPVGLSTKEAAQKPASTKTPPDSKEAKDDASDDNARTKAEIKELLAHATNPELTYQELTEAADTIVIATLAESMVRSDVDYRDDDHRDAADSERIPSVDSRFTIKTVLKGKLFTDHLTVAHLQQPEGIDLGSQRLITFHKRLKAPMIATHHDDDRVRVVHAAGTDFEEAVPEYLLFLKRRPDGRFEPAAGQSRASDAARIVNLVYLE